MGAPSGVEWTDVKLSQSEPRQAQENWGSAKQIWNAVPDTQVWENLEWPVESA